MAITSNVYVRTAVDFVHDISAGVFPGAVMAAWMITGRVQETPEAVEAVGDAMSALWLVLLVALAAIVATGALRLQYWRLNVRNGYLETKTKTVWIKHGAFVAVLIGSIVMMFSLF